MSDNNIVLGILAHVDAGKTTLSEAMLYLSGKLKKLGRVDHRDSFLDNNSLERARGITIFSKQAVMPLGEMTVSLLDTPGHVDFSAEAERSLQVLDYAVLVISGTDGVQAHTETLWKLLERYNVPVFIFVTKMDLPCCDRQEIMDGLRTRLSERCVDFSAEGEALFESAAMCSEEAMDEYIETGSIGAERLRDMLRRREIFPCCFGSGLRTEGVAEFLDMLELYARPGDYGEDFSARVYKIARDAQGNRMTFMKVTGGALRVRSLMKYADRDGNAFEEKISQLRIYSGAKYDTAETVRPGQICAALGLTETYPGQGLGAAGDFAEPLLEPVMSYRVILPPQSDPAVLLPKLMQLDQEDPQLHIVWNERTREISVQLMGRVQAEIFRSLVKERFDTDITLDTGRIMYRETIKDTVEGVGHFEPLRHYAEVHLLLEPLPRGSGIELSSSCPEDELDRSWQQLILTHLAEKQHIGVLTGSPVTDIRFTLAAGRAHIKHTEGGDFRQATYRAVRQGLMQAESVLLEPWYSFVLEVPAEQIGRAISDVRAMNGEIDSPEDAGGMMRLEGAAPVAGMNEYMQELLAYTHGRGRLSLTPGGYRACRDQQKIVDAIGYEPERDTDNPADSVFCSHGAGVNIPWDQAKDYMHLESCLKPPVEETAPAAAPRYRSLSIDDRELEAIMEREFGKIKRPQYSARQVNAAASEPVFEKKPEFIIVDGYNLIFAWDELKKLAADRLDLARGRLMDMLSNYCGFTKAKLVLVFDGFRTPGNPGSREDYHNINVAFTKDGETGDAYIERLADEIGKNYSVRVVTSDNLIRLSALRSGVLRCSSGEFKNEVEWVLGQIDAVLKKSNESAHKTRIADKINGKQ
ncbi:MAG: translation elongation factor G [Clostridiales bacterium]|nr:MAG: translation elongation factor G [Clostridiales bacterium]